MDIIEATATDPVYNTTRVLNYEVRLKVPQYIKKKAMIKKMIGSWKATQYNNISSYGNPIYNKNTAQKIYLPLKYEGSEINESKFSYSFINYADNYIDGCGMVIVFRGSINLGQINIPEVLDPVKDNLDKLLRERIIRMTAQMISRDHEWIKGEVRFSYSESLEVQIENHEALYNTGYTGPTQYVEVAKPDITSEQVNEDGEFVDPCETSDGQS